MKELTETEEQIHDRRHKGYKLIGWAQKTNPATGVKEDIKVSTIKVANGTYPYGKVPVWRYLGYGMKNKY